MVQSGQGKAVQRSAESAVVAPATQNGTGCVQCLAALAPGALP